MRLIIILTTFLLTGFCLQAQPNPTAEGRFFLLRELRLTALQKAQIAQIIREEKMQEYLRERKLEDVLTPEQRKKLRQYQKDKMQLKKE